MTSGALWPSLKRKSRRLKGVWGASSAVTMSCPVLGLARLSAGTLTETPRLWVLDHHVEGDQGVEGVLCSRLPRVWIVLLGEEDRALQGLSGAIGVSTCRVPTFEELGQPSPSGVVAVSLRRSAGVQTPSPSPTEGLIVIPSGRVTTAFLVSDWARPSTSLRPSPAWSTGSSKLSSKSRPVPVSAESVLGWEEIAGMY